MIALHGAVAFIEGEDVAVLIGDDLDFDVADVFEVAFDEEAGVAEGSFGHGGSLDEGVFEFLHGADDEDAATAAAAFSLEHDGQTDFLDDLARAVDVDRAVGTGHDGHADPGGEISGLHLVARAGSWIRRWSR